MRKTVAKLPEVFFAQHLGVSAVGSSGHRGRVSTPFALYSPNIRIYFSLGPFRRCDLNVAQLLEAPFESCYNSGAIDRTPGGSVGYTENAA
jgi:hypothetical protein